MKTVNNNLQKFAFCVNQWLQNIANTERTLSVAKWLQILGVQVAVDTERSEVVVTTKYVIIGQDY